MQLLLFADWQLSPDAIKCRFQGVSALPVSSQQIAGCENVTAQLTLERGCPCVIDEARIAISTSWASVA